MNHLLNIDIPPEWNGLMIKEILLDYLNFSRKSLIKIKNNAGIYLNRKPTFVTMRVNTGDTLDIYVVEETSPEIIPQPIPLDIYYEDNDIIVINKQPDIVVHPTRNYYLNTIANGLMYYWQTKGEQYRFRPVNRLDKDTSGLFVVAKNQYSHHKLALQLNNRTLKRIYHAIVHGKIERDFIQWGIQLPLNVSRVHTGFNRPLLPAVYRGGGLRAIKSSVKEVDGIIDAPILKDPNHGTKRLIEFNNSEAKKAKTYYKTIKTNDNYSLIELELATGRTHQIRVHMSWLGHPLVGDDLYGGSLELFNRQALHAIRLTFSHPVTNKILSFKADYPDDMKNFLDNYLV